MPKGVIKPATEREVAKKAGVSQVLVNRKRRQGKTDDQIVAEAQSRRSAAAARKPITGRTALKPKETYADAQARKETALANLRELEEQEKSGSLVQVAMVTLVWSDISSKLKDSLLGLPSRIVNRLPDEIRRQVYTVADEEVRVSLKAIADEIRPEAYRAT